MSKSLIENKKKLRKNHRNFKSYSHLLIKLHILQKQLHLLINKSKQSYYARMASKLTMFKEFLIYTCLKVKPFFKQQKIPLIPRRRICEKPKLFNAFHAKQLSLINNNKLPSQHH